MDWFNILGSLAVIVLGASALKLTGKAPPKSKLQ
jgi:hypothetical protein